MALPNPNRAVIDIRKLRDYCLSPTNPVGKHKARVFLSVLGFTDADAEFMRELIRMALSANEAVLVKTDEYGDRYYFDFIAVTQTGQATIRTAWIVKSGEDYLRLTSCYILEG